MSNIAEKRFLLPGYQDAAPVLLIIIGATLTMMEGGEYQLLHQFLAWWDTYVVLPVRRSINKTLQVIFFIVAGVEIIGALPGGKLCFRRKAVLLAGAPLGGALLAIFCSLLITLNDSVLQIWIDDPATDIALLLGLLVMFKTEESLAQDLVKTAFALIDELKRALVHQVR